MKKIVLYFIFLVLLLSCNSKDDKDGASVLKEVKSITDTSGQFGLKRKSNIKKMDTVDFITIGKLDIMMHDFGLLDVKQAEEDCQKLDGGWRLPNESELILIYNENNRLGTFDNIYYTGIESGTDAYSENADEKMYIRISILNGEIVVLQTDQEIYSVYGVRLVRDHTTN